MKSTTLAARVSAALRQADLELPVLRYSDSLKGRGHTGIRVGSHLGDAAAVFFHVYRDDYSNDTDPEQELAMSEKARAILIARGFQVDPPTPGRAMLVVRNGARDSGEVEDVAAVTAASGLEISQPAPNEWHVAIGGRRGAYVIRRTGKDARTSFAVRARLAPAPLASNLRTMTEAINAVEHDIESNS